MTNISRYLVERNIRLLFYEGILLGLIAGVLLTLGAQWLI